MGNEETEDEKKDRILAAAGNSSWHLPVFNYGDK